MREQRELHFDNWTNIFPFFFSRCFPIEINNNNKKTFSPCFHRAIETPVKVWVNSIKLNTRPWFVGTRGSCSHNIPCSPKLQLVLFLIYFLIFSKGPVETRQKELYMLVYLAYMCLIYYFMKTTSTHIGYLWKILTYMLDISLSISLSMRHR